MFETADEDDGAICECFYSGVPAQVLNGEHGRVVEPLSPWRTSWLGIRVEYTDSLSAIVVAVDIIIGRGRRWLEGLSFHTENKGKVRS